MVHSNTGQCRAQSRKLLLLPRGQSAHQQQMLTHQLILVFLQRITRTLRRKNCKFIHLFISSFAQNCLNLIRFKIMSSFKVRKCDSGGFYFPVFSNPINAHFPKMGTMMPYNSITELFIISFK